MFEQRAEGGAGKRRSGSPKQSEPATETRAIMTTAMLARPATSPAGALRLLTSARRALVEAQRTGDPLERYAFSHLAGLRAAAALLADRARPGTPKTRRPTSVWTLLVRVAPELEPWAEYFAAGAGKRAAAEAGMRGAVTTREADDLMRDAGEFVAMIETTLGLLAMPTA